MFVSNYYQHLNPITPETKETSAQGRWWHFHRVYILKDENEKMLTLRLNWFERVLIHLRYCSMEQFFSAVFQEKRITYISPKGPAEVLKEITPANFEETIEVWKHHVTDKENLVGIITILNLYNNHYIFRIRFPNQSIPKMPGWSHFRVGVQNNRFVVHTQLNPKDIPYDNLKEVLDHCFRGQYYQEDLFKTMPYFTLTNKDGSKIQYNNPYL